MLRTPQNPSHPQTREVFQVQVPPQLQHGTPLPSDALGNGSSRNTTRESPSKFFGNLHTSREFVQAKSTNREIRANSRERICTNNRLNNGTQRDNCTREFSRSFDFPQKLHENINKSSHSQEFLSKVQEIQAKFQEQSSPQDFSSKNKNPSPFSYKSQTNKPITPSSSASASSAVNSAINERVTSPHKFTSPNVKLSDSQSPRLSSPTRSSDYKSALGNSKSDDINPNALNEVHQNNKSQYVRQFQEREISNSSNKGPVWEGECLHNFDKFHNGNDNSQPSTVPGTVNVAQSTPVSVHFQPASTILEEKTTQEEAVNENTILNKSSSPAKSSELTSILNKNKDDLRNSSFRLNNNSFSIEKTQDNYLQKNGITPKAISGHPNANNIKSPLPNLPSSSPNFNGFQKEQKVNLATHVRYHQGHQSGYGTSESTDCGTLSTSYSDGDYMVNRKRPPTKLKSKRRNLLAFPQHLSTEDSKNTQRRNDSFNCGGSSSDENRSSGHASMSDGHSSSSPPVDSLLRHQHSSKPNLKSVSEEERFVLNSSTHINHGIPAECSSGEPARRFPVRPRGKVISKDDLSLSLESASGLDDIKQAIEQLTMRSQGSRTSYSTSTYSSVSGSESEPVRRLIRHSSLDTINTNITSAADEFVWVDSHNRLVELQQLPWNNHDVLRVIQQGRVREQLDRVSMEAVPRLSYLLQRALVRVAREAQRLARSGGMCSKREILSAFKIVLSPALADSCLKACLRSAAMFTVSGDQQRQAKSTRGGLHLSVSRFMRWLCDVRLGKFIHEYASVYLTAGMENLLEEIILQSLPAEVDHLLSAATLEHAIANNGDLWGLLQPYAHLNAGRTATGALCIPKSNSSNSMERSSTSTSLNDSIPESTMMIPSGVNASSLSIGSSSTENGGHSISNTGIDSRMNGNSQCSSSLTLTPDDSTRSFKVRISCQNFEQILLTTCMGSLCELSELVQRVIPYLHKTANSASATRPHITWSSSALSALFYFMRCSQLEHAEHACRAPIQELVYERPYIVLPPLVEWVRVVMAHTEHRNSSVADKDDVLQAARLLLPGVDCPVRMIGYEDILCGRKIFDGVECAKKYKIDLAFKMLSCGRIDLIPHALQLLPASKINTINEYGLTPLMIGCIRGEEGMVRMLIEAGADVDAETPPVSAEYSMANPETQHWTALTYAAIQGHASIAKILLEKKANVEGGARLSEEKCTETPLQVASGAGNLDMMSLLLSYGANPYLSTLMKDSLCYSGAAQKGCYAAIAVAAAHGQRLALHKLLSQPQQACSREVLSLEEILAEGASNQTTERDKRSNLLSPSSNEGVPGEVYCQSEFSHIIKLSKQQIKTLQEAMYHSAESGHLELSLDLRNLGVPWTLHCWMHTLATAHEHRLESIIDQLLQDFLQDWPEDCSTQFVDECLPLLFTIFRYSKNEGTTLLLADIFSSCYSKDPIKEIRDTSISSGVRIDPKYVNSPELSDVQFRLEGKVFYAHKIILVNASPRFRQMLNSKVCGDGNPPVVQIHDIRYDIFALVMKSLYKGGCENLEVESSEILELMAAANFFQLDSLLRYCEARCSQLVRIENVVSMYIHAKVYGAMQLLEFCQGFLLQNMVALLTYDDSVRKLIFGKKIHNHDVLSGLLLTLQARINSKASPRAGKK